MVCHASTARACRPCCHSPRPITTASVTAGSGRLSGLKRDAVFLEFLIEQGTVDTEHLRGAGLVEPSGFQSPAKGFLFGRMLDASEGLEGRLGDALTF